jgi:endo-1,4-beta-mannosidase
MVAAANTKMPTNNNIAARPLPAISTPPQVVDTQTTPTHRTTITTPINNSSDHHTVVTQITTTTTTVVGMTAIKLREVAVVDLSNPPSTPTPNSSQAVRLILLQEVGQVAVAEVGSKFEEEEGQVAAVDTAEEEVVVETKNHYLFFSSFLLSPITTVQPLSL